MTRRRRHTSAETRDESQVVAALDEAGDYELA